MSEAEGFVKDFMERDGYKVSRGEGYDFNADKDDLRLAIEVKSTDSLKPAGKIVIDWSQIEALVRAANNGRKAYLFLAAKGLPFFLRHFRFG